MTRVYKVKSGDILFSENNGFFYQIIGKSGKLYEVRSWFENEDGQIDDESLTKGYVTDHELKALLKEKTGLNYEIEWEGEEC